MTFLEGIILKLTRETPNGGSCRVGDACIKVWYCSDIWEWEYQGETFWDVQDLAEAIIRESRTAPQGTIPAPNKARTLREIVHDRTSPEGFFAGSGEADWGGVP